MPESFDHEFRYRPAIDQFLVVRKTLDMLTRNQFPYNPQLQVPYSNLSIAAMVIKCILKNITLDLGPPATLNYPGNS